MSDNKFIKHLRGENTAKSVLEIKNQKTPTSFGNMPEGNTSNANDVYSDHRGDAAGVLKGTENWKLDGQDLVETTTIYGDGRDFSNSTYDASGNTLWVDATYTFATARRFMPNTKFVLKLCGHDLETVLNNTIDFTLIVKIGNGLVSKTFTVTEQAFNFCKEFVIDFGESNSAMLKADAGSSMQVQLLCADANAQAVIYNGMTVFTALQRRVDSETVSSDTQSLDEIEYELASHINDKNNPHEVTKAQVGLGNCDNTSDLDKPVSTATQAALDGKVSKTGDTMDGQYTLLWGSRFSYISNTNVRFDTLAWGGDEFAVVKWYNTTYNRAVMFKGSSSSASLYPVLDSDHTLGLPDKRWQRIYVKEICGDTAGQYVLTMPQQSGVIATKDDVDQAANSGSMITDTGLWYAKMYAATVAPAAANGTNYADFSQVDGQGNPIIVIYERQNDAWVQIETITPPALYDGYVPITKKIWDIAEQDGQQGGRILWNHSSKEFTPYPNIVTTDGLTITNSTITTSSFSGVASLSATSTVIVDNPTLNSIVNYGFVIDRQNWQNIADVTWAAATTIVLSNDKTIYFIDATGNTTITIDASAISVVAGDAKTFEIHIACGGSLPTITWVGIDNWLIDSETTPIEANATSIFAIRVQQRPSDAAPRVVANYGGAY
jgi:hypothetical protein